MEPISVKLPPIEEQRAFLESLRPDVTQYNGDPMYLRELLENADISQRQAAKHLGIGFSRLKEYLNLNGSGKYPYCVQYAIEQLTRQF